MAKKLVLAVIDSLKPEQLDRAVAAGQAPVLAKLLEDGTYVRDCLSVYPSVTPVAAAAITTGLGPDQHRIPSMNWYHRGEERYVEYGSSFPATRAHGVFRSLFDTVYNMNMAHLSREVKTVFEHLDDAGLRTAGTTYLIWRGRHRHEPSGVSMYRRVAEAAQFRHPVWGPREFFYADLFDSRDTDCTATLGMPGQRDRHSGCVGEQLVEHDLFDFLLFSLPDNDAFSHRYGPAEQVRSIAEADRALAQLMEPAGGPEAFLEDHAVIVMSDHSQIPVEARVNLADVLSPWRLLAPADVAPDEAEVAICPAARSAMVYALDEETRDRTTFDLVDDLTDVDGVDLVSRRLNGEAAVRSTKGELRFAPGGDLTDDRGGSWSVEGDTAVLGLRTGDGHVGSSAYPDALGRLWSALNCVQSGDVLLSATPGYEFVDWGGSDHVGGGSHGSLHASDSEGALIMHGIGPATAEERPSWSLRDVLPMVLDHFGVAS